MRARIYKAMKPNAVDEYPWTLLIVPQRPEHFTDDDRPRLPYGRTLWSSREEATKFLDSALKAGVLT